MAVLARRLAVAGHKLATIGHILAVAGHRLAVVAGHSQDDRTGQSVGSDQIGLQEGVVAFADSLAARMVAQTRLSSFYVTCQ